MIRVYVLLDEHSQDTLEEIFMVETKMRDVDRISGGKKVRVLWPRTERESASKLKRMILKQNFLPSRRDVARCERVLPEIRAAR